MAFPSFPTSPSQLTSTPPLHNSLTLTSSHRYLIFDENSGVAPPSSPNMWKGEDIDPARGGGGVAEWGEGGGGDVVDKLDK